MAELEPGILFHFRRRRFDPEFSETGRVESLDLPGSMCLPHDRENPELTEIENERWSIFKLGKAMRKVRLALQMRSLHK